MTIWAKATKTGMDDSEIATATYTIVTIEHAGTEADPYSVADARNLIDQGEPYPQGVYATGIVCTASTTLYQEKYLSYYISADGSTESDQLEAYNGLGINGASFTSVDDVQVGDIVVIKGNLTKYNNTYEFAANNQLVSLVRPIDARNVSIAYGATSGSIVYTIDNSIVGGVLTAATESDWLTLPSTYASPIRFTCTANTTTTARTATVVLTYTYNRTTVTKNVTVTQAAYEAPIVTWDLSIDQTATATENEMTWTSDYATMGVVKANASTNTNNYYPGTEGQSYTSTRFYKNSVLTIAPAAGYAITSVVFDATTSGYANAFQSSTWTNATASVEDDIVTVIPTNRTNAFSAVISGTCGFTSVTVYYLKAYTLTIDGYTDETSKAGYYLIASPVEVDPATVEGMILNGDDAVNYDLYSFDQTGGGANGDGKEWRNYKQETFNLVPGKGYLYAKKATDENPSYSFALTGTPYDGDGEIELEFAEGEGINFPGLNLIGNPFTEEAGLDLPFYRMNTANGELVAVSEGSVQPMEGVFVYTTTMTDPETGDQIVVPAHFTAGIGSSTGNDKLIMNLSRQGNTIDRAIVRFDEGSMLPKFQLNPNNTKIYVNEGNKDYAIVRSAAEAEMPVSFRASENGTYTLAVEAENVEMNYLHLIDNLTGMDVDLLQTPSYTFEAKTSDYTSRFRLVFKANGTNENNAETFAYFNGTNWTVGNVGEATLQVVDVTGRTVANQMINGNAELNLNQPAGVYVIRLVNGDNVKTQKVVVR